MKVGRGRKGDLKWVLWSIVIWIMQPNFSKVPNGIPLDYLPNRPIVPVRQYFYTWEQIKGQKSCWKQYERLAIILLVLDDFRVLSWNTWTFPVVDVFSHFRSNEFLGYDFGCPTSAGMRAVLKSLEDPSSWRRRDKRPNRIAGNVKELYSIAEGYWFQNQRSQVLDHWLVDLWFDRGWWKLAGTDVHARRLFVS